MKLRNLNFLTILSFFLLFSACSAETGEEVGRAPRRTGADSPEGPCTVGFWMDDESTKTAVGPDAQSVLWEDDDHLALWAFRQDASRVLSAQDFIVYGRSSTRTFFSTTLPSPMAEGRYWYWAAAPRPSQVGNGFACFPIPSVQDGKGAGVMLSDLTEAGPLKARSDYGRDEGLALQMRQQLHLLRFYIQDDKHLLGSETVEKIECSFPAQVSGTLRTDLPVPSGTPVSLSAPVLQDGNTSLSLVLDKPLSVSDDKERRYAFATIFPRKWGQDDTFSLRLYTQSKIAIVDDIPLGGRDMQAGHATTVKIAPDHLREYRRIFVNFRSNPIGEPVQSITLTAPSGCKWSDKGGNTYKITPGGNIVPGNTFLLEYEDASAFKSLSGKTITVTYDSEHLVCTQKISIPNLSGAISTTLNLDVAPLLSEDFSGVGDFSSNDTFVTSSVGAKDPVTFLNGWAGARVGGKAGVGVRLACRREGGLWVSAEYDSRMESAPLACKIKKAVKLKLNFDYGSGGSYTMMLGSALGQTIHVGYITTTSNYKSNSTSGTYPHSFKINASECDGEGGYSATSKSKSLVISAPVTDILRISWRSVIDEKSDFGSSNTDWFYLDNVSVTVNP